jgi:two-component sensor histidine kinase
MAELIELDGYRTVSSDLLREANHRIANHLAILSALIQRQMSAVRRGPELLSRETAAELLQDTAAKVVAIGNLHRHIAAGKRDSEIDLGELLIESHNGMVKSLSLHEHASTKLKLGSGCVVTPDQASTLMLIVGEILMNALKYAHPTGIPVEICMACARSLDDEIVLDICDDGVGLPEGFDEVRDGGIGLKLIRSLTERIGATLHMESSDLGLSFRIALPCANRGDSHPAGAIVYAADRSPERHS